MCVCGRPSCASFQFSRFHSFALAGPSTYSPLLLCVRHRFEYIRPPRHALTRNNVVPLSAYTAKQCNVIRGLTDLQCRYICINRYVTYVMERENNPICENYILRFVYVYGWNARANTHITNYDVPQLRKNRIVLSIHQLYTASYVYTICLYLNYCIVAEIHDYFTYLHPICKYE